MPVDFNIHAYRMVVQNPELLGAYYNSVRYAVLGTVIYILATSLVAYPLTIRGFWLNKPATLVYVLTMFVSGGLIPTYLMYRALGLLDTIWVMVLPGGGDGVRRDPVQDQLPGPGQRAPRSRLYGRGRRLPGVVPHRHAALEAYHRHPCAVSHRGDLE